MIEKSSKVIQNDKILVLVQQVEKDGIEKDLVSYVKNRFISDHTKISAKAWLKLIEAFLKQPESYLKTAILLSPQICKKYRRSDPIAVKNLLKGRHGEMNIF